MFGAALILAAVATKAHALVVPHSAVEVCRNALQSLVFEAHKNPSLPLAEHYRERSAAKEALRQRWRLEGSGFDPEALDELCEAMIWSFEEGTNDAMARQLEIEGAKAQLP